MKRDTTLHIGNIGVFTAIATSVLGMQSATYATQCGKRRNAEYIAEDINAVKRAAQENHLCLTCVRNAKMSERMGVGILWPADIRKAKGVGE